MQHAFARRQPADADHVVQQTLLPPLRCFQDGLREGVPGLQVREQWIGQVDRLDPRQGDDTPATNVRVLLDNEGVAGQ